jgi:hypothetical protein
MASIVFAAVFAAALALGWWLLRRRRPAPVVEWGPEPPFPGWDMYEGDLRYTDYASKKRMVERRVSEEDVRYVLANPERVKGPDEQDRTATEALLPDLRTLRVVTAPSSDGAALWVINTIVLDRKITKVRLKEGWRTRMLYADLDRIKGTGADIFISETDERGGVTVTITSLIEPFRRDAVAMVSAVAEAKQ